jgi:hypothetical protein
MKVDEVGRLTGIVPSWAEGLMLDADGHHEAEFYMKAWLLGLETYLLRFLYL